MKKIVVWLMTFGVIVILLTGCGRPHTSPAYPVPAKVTWKGATYTTGGALKNEEIEKKLGTTDKKSSYPVYSIKGHNPMKEIAIVVNNPNKHYVVAINKK